MTREELVFALDHYATTYAKEAAFAPRFVSLLNNFPGCFHRELLSGHITGSAWVVSESNEEVLLLHHKKLDRWLQPGGHADGEDDVLKVAAKELEEETGLSSYAWVSENIFDIDIHVIPARQTERAHFHFDIRFMARAKLSTPLSVSDESRALQWFPLKSITNEAGFEESILRMVNKTQVLGAS